MRRNILYMIGSIIVIAIVCIAVMYNKPHRKAENEKGIPVNAAALCKEYQENESAANEKYLNKTLSVSGSIKNMSVNQDGATVAELAGDGEVVVLCTLRDKNTSLHAGDNVVIKGFCSSNTMFDVLLTDCILIQNK